jgi:hypothetical protein
LYCPCSFFDALRAEMILITLPSRRSQKHTKSTRRPIEKPMNRSSSAE